VWQAAESDDIQLRVAAALEETAPQETLRSDTAVRSEAAAFGLPVAPYAAPLETAAQQSRRRDTFAPLRCLRASLSALLLLFPATALAASSAAALGARGAAGLRAVALVFTGASGLALCVAATLAAGSGACRVNGPRW
jgi:hypothetical protein